AFGVMPRLAGKSEAMAVEFEQRMLNFAVSLPDLSKSFSDARVEFISNRSRVEQLVAMPDSDYRQHKASWSQREETFGGSDSKKKVKTPNYGDYLYTKERKAKLQEIQRLLGCILLDAEEVVPHLSAKEKQQLRRAMERFSDQQSFSERSINDHKLSAVFSL